MRTKEHHKPCRNCGGTRVTRTVVNVTDEPSKEYVIVTCFSCETRRGGYARNKTNHLVGGK